AAGAQAAAGTTPSRGYRPASEQPYERSYWRSVEGQRRSRVGDIGPDRLQLRVLVVRVERFVPPPKAGELESSERRAYVTLAVTVNRHPSGADVPRHSMRAADVGGEDGGREAIGRVVCDADCLVGAGHRDDRKDRPEDLFARDRHPGGHIVED